MKDKTLKEVQKRITAGWSAFGKYKFIFTNREMPISLKRKTFNACTIPAMTYGCKTWTLTKTIVHKLQVAQRAMERKILGIKITDKIPNEEITVQTNILNIIKHITSTKWRWAGHVARMQDNRWTIRTTEWQVRKGRRPRGRPKMRWKDDIMKWQGATWTRTQKTERSGKNLPRATFSSGGTQPRYKVQGTMSEEFSSYFSLITRVSLSSWSSCSSLEFKPVCECTV